MQKKLFIGFLTILLGGLFFLQLGLLPVHATSPLTYPITNPITYPVIDYPTPTPTIPPVTYPITFPITYFGPTPTPTPLLEGKITGSHVDQNGHPIVIDGQKVTISNSDNSYSVMIPNAPEWSASIPPGTYTITAHAVSGYTISSSLCLDCTFHPDFNNGNSVTIFLEESQTLDIVFKYTPIPLEEPSIAPSVAPEPQTSNSGNSQGSNDTKHNSSCGDAQPTSVPYLVSAISSGKNQVTIFWNKATDPVTHYAIVYGAASGKEQYGVLNAGGREATIFTIDNLSGGATYYFRVRAVNGCMNSALSNELSVKASGNAIKQTALKDKVMGASAVKKAVAKHVPQVQKNIVKQTEDNRIFSTVKTIFNAIKGFFIK